MAGGAARKGKGTGWGRRLVRFGAWTALGFFGGSLLLVGLLRFVHPPVSGVRVQRRIQSWFGEEPYHPRATWVDLEDIAPCMGLAVIAAEDQNFPDHKGFDWEAIQRAVEHNERSRKKRGASTVSQQTAKNRFLAESGG